MNDKFPNGLVSEKILKFNFFFKFYQRDFGECEYTEETSLVSGA